MKVKVAVICLVLLGALTFAQGNPVVQVDVGNDRQVANKGSEDGIFFNFRGKGMPYQMKTPPEVGQAIGDYVGRSPSGKESTNKDALASNRPVSSLNGAASFSLGIWVTYVGGNANARLVCNSDENLKGGMDIFRFNDRRFVLRVNGIMAEAPMSENLGQTKDGKTKWQYVAVTYDGTKTADNVTYYMGDGTTLKKLNTTTLNAGMVKMSRQPLCVMNHPTLDRELVGLFDGLRIQVSGTDGSGVLSQEALGSWMGAPIEEVEKTASEANAGGTLKKKITAEAKGPLPQPFIHLGSYGKPFANMGGSFKEGTTLYQGLKGQALRYAKIREGYNLGGFEWNVPGTDAAFKACTVLFWGALHSDGAYFSWENADSSEGIGLYICAGQLVLQVNGHEVMCSPQGLWKPGVANWRMVAATYDGKEATFYMGTEYELYQLATMPLAAGAVNPGDNTLMLGNRKQQDARVHALIDSVRFFRGETLSEAEVNTIYLHDKINNRPDLNARVMQSGLPGQKKEVRYETIGWELARGNHRATVKLSEGQDKLDVVRAVLPLRRQAVFPKVNDVEVRNLETEQAIGQWAVLEYSREKLDVAFQPIEGVMEYVIYYAIWRAPEEHASSEWTKKVEAGIDIPQAEIVAMQARTQMDRFDPMAVTALPEETKAFLKKHEDAPYLLFPEKGQNGVRMYHDLPLHWTQQGPERLLQLQGSRNEYIAFQIGCFAARQELKNLRVRFEALKGPDGASVPASEFTCFNTEGSDTWGQPFEKTVHLAKGQVLPLWCGVQMPADAAPGTYKTVCTVEADNAPSRRAEVVIEMDDQLLEFHGDKENRNLSRLRWLNEKNGLDNTITKPYTPIGIVGETIQVLGRDITLGQGGLPQAIRSNGEEVLAAPISWQMKTENGGYVTPGGPVEWVRKDADRVEWRNATQGPGLKMQLDGLMEFDGYGELIMQVTAEEDTRITDMELTIPMQAEHAEYMDGLGVRPGYRPASLEWKWGLPHDSFWLGSPEAGFYGRFKGERDHVVWRTWEEYEIPDSWNNDGKGRVRIAESDGAVYLRAATGTRVLKKGETVRFRFAFMATPVKSMTDERWDYRHIHRNIVSSNDIGATRAVIHHAGYINPYINYPFPFADIQKQYSKMARDKNIWLMLYYSHCRISVHIEELWALRSLREELLDTNTQEEYVTDGSFDNVTTNDVPWLREHLVRDFIPGWQNNLPNGEVDIALVPKNYPTRYDNFYVSGADFLMRYMPLGGFYQDGHRQNRKTAQRLYRVIKAANPDGLINYHSGNPFKKPAGFQDAIMWCMENLPYTDSIWFGENFRYQNMPPDQWMVSVSGIPFGVPGEMLSIAPHPANLWRGMLYGMDQRIYGAAVGDPSELWALWDEFGIQEAEAIGYWKDDLPVATGDKDILATVYAKPDKAMIVLASWAPEKRDITLDLDWDALGFGPEGYHLRAPAFTACQPARTFELDESLPIEPVKGWLLILEKD